MAAFPWVKVTAAEDRAKPVGFVPRIRVLVGYDIWPEIERGGGKDCVLHRTDKLGVICEQFLHVIFVFFVYLREIKLEHSYRCDVSAGRG